jgi:hypothetical protein
MDIESLCEIRTRSEIRKGWWLEQRYSVVCALPPDGLIVVFRRKDVEAIFDEIYPHRGSGFNKVWYFNASRDREIAEIDADGRVCANPQALLSLPDRAVNERLKDIEPMKDH